MTFKNNFNQLYCSNNPNQKKKQPCNLLFQEQNSEKLKFNSRNLKKRESGFPFDEEIIVKDLNGIVRKVQIGSMENSWQGLKVLSINKDEKQFGSPKFIPIKDYNKGESSFLLKIRLADGRQIICSPNQIIPILVIFIRIHAYNNQKNTWSIDYKKAQDIRNGDNMLVLHKIPFSSNVSYYLFIPRILNWENRWVGIHRNDYLKFSFRKNQKTEDPLIKLINSKFQYSKPAKIYRTLWSNLSVSEKYLLEMEARRNQVKILVKIHEKVGYWYSSIIPLTNDFFRYLGWYVAEGSKDKNRITISQSKEKNYTNWQEIINLLDNLNFPSSVSGEKSIRINSNILAKLTVKLCSKLAQNKKIPFELFNIERANAFLDAYYKGDGCQKTAGLKKFTTASQQLMNDLVSILGATGYYCSIWYPSPSDNCYRITEINDKHYRRKFMGLIKFNSTTPLRVKYVKIIEKNLEIFNLKTEHGWFVSTNGILIHNNLP